MKDEVIEDIVNDVIKKLDDAPFGITDEELEHQEIITNETGEENESSVQ